MQADKTDNADRRGLSGSDPGDSGGTPQPSSSKIKDKLEKWRIHSAQIEFPEETRESRGGYGTVSRALLVYTTGSDSGVDVSPGAEGENKSDDGTSRRKTIAVKKLNIEDEKDKERVLGLALREAGFLIELSHENIIDLEGFVEDLSKDKVWLVFPWAAKGNLKEFAASEEWEIPERISLINDVVEGVKYLHNQNPPIYHGDLKSLNVLVNSKYRAVITDFGSARRLARTNPTAQPKKRANEAQPALLLEAEICEATNTITLTGNQYTLRWAAPELLMDDEPGLWSDIWALGWIFYEVMTNAIPFQSIQKDSVVVICVIQGNLPSVADHAGMVLIRRLYSLMIACWNIDPSKRPTAEDCRKSIDLMPMIIPNPQRASNTSGSRARSHELLMKLGCMHRYQNDYTNASKFYTEALGICTGIGDRGGEAKALLGLARVHKLQNEYREAVTFYSQAVQICTDIGDRGGRADALWGLAEVHRLQSEYNSAVTFYSEAVQICTDLGNRQVRADSLWGLGEVHRAQHEYSRAVTFYSEAVQICTDIGDRQGRADSLCGLGEVHRAQNKYSEAITFYSEAVQICTDVGSRQGRADALGGLADVHRLQKHYSQAAQLFSETLQIRIDIGDRHGRAWALMGLADLHRDQDQHEDAIRLYEQAARIFEEIGDTRGAAIGLKRAAEARQQLERAEAE